MSPCRSGTAATACTRKARSAPEPDFYKEVVLAHYERPRNRGELEGADIEEHLNNPLCGDKVTGLR